MRFGDVIGQQAVVGKVRQALINGRIPNAFMLVGADGYGGLPLALAITKFLQCSAKGPLEACNQCPSCIKNNKLQHPDVVYIFPNNNAGSINKNPTSKKFLTEWRAAVLAAPNLNMAEWLDQLGIDNKVGIINNQDSADIIHELSYKPFESAYRVVIIWMPETMNDNAANRLLKSLEEPPKGTVFLLVTQDTSTIPATVLSRTQAVRLMRPSDQDIENGLVNATGIDRANALRIATMVSGNYRLALELARNPALFDDPTKQFIRWMRASYTMNVEDLASIADDFVKWGREAQKVFLAQAQTTLRKVLLYANGTLAPEQILPEEADFFKRFSPFINANNALLISNEFDKASYHIERSASGRIVFIDLSLIIVDALREASMNKVA